MKKLAIFSSLFLVFFLTGCGETLPSESVAPISESGIPESKIYTVTIDGVEHKVIEGEKAPLPILEDTENSVFVFWMEGTSEFDPDTPIFRDYNLVSFFRDRLTFKVYFDDVFVEVKEGSKVTYQAPVEKPGFEFQGWFLDNNLFDFDTLINKDTHLVSKWVNTNYETNDYVSLGELGGKNALKVNAFAKREHDDLFFKFETTKTVTSYDSIGVFLQLGSNTYEYKNLNTVLVTSYFCDRIAIYNYPGTAKVSLYDGGNLNSQNVKTQVKTNEGKTELFVKINLKSFSILGGNDPYKSLSTIGLTMTADNNQSSTFDSWERADMPGFNQKALVDKESPRDYIRLTKTNLLFSNNDNDLDTFLKGNIGVEKVKVSAMGKSVYSDANGDWNLGFVAEGNEVEIKYEKEYYETKVEFLTYEEGKAIYELSNTIEEQIGNVQFILKNKAGEPVLNKEILINGQTYSSDSEGKVMVQNIGLDHSINVVSESDSLYLETSRFYEKSGVLVGNLNEIQLVKITDNKEVSINVFDIKGVALDGVNVQIEGGSSKQTIDGKVKFDVTYSGSKLIISKEGFRTTELNLSTEDLIDFDSFNISIAYGFKSLGSIGGTKTKKWDINITRIQEGLAFDFVYDDPTPFNINDKMNGMTIFLNVGEARSKNRCDYVYVINTFAGSEAPTAQAWFDGTSSSINVDGISKSFDTATNTLHVVIRYDTFAEQTSAVFKNYDGSIDPTGKVGLSFTSVYNSSGTYEVFYYPELQGFNQKDEVDRSNILDYLCWNVDNSITQFDSTGGKDLCNRLAKTNNIQVEGKEDIFENLAVIAPAKGSLQKCNIGSFFYTDRTGGKKFTNTTPECLIGLSYEYYGLGSTDQQIVVKTDGYVLLMISNSTTYTANKFFVVEQGFSMLLYSWDNVPNEDNLDYLVKYCKAGEVITYAKGSNNLVYAVAFGK